MLIGGRKYKKVRKKKGTSTVTALCYSVLELVKQAQ
jgi:hypothetical protein